MNDTKQVVLEISHDSIDSLVLRELSDLARRLESDLRNRINGTGVAVFEQDKVTDIKKIQEHIRSVSNVISWYTVK